MESTHTTKFQVIQTSSFTRHLCHKAKIRCFDLIKYASQKQNTDNDEWQMLTVLTRCLMHAYAHPSCMYMYFTSMMHAYVLHIYHASLLQTKWDITDKVFLLIYPSHNLARELNEPGQHNKALDMPHLEKGISILHWDHIRFIGTFKIKVHSMERLVTYSFFKTS